MKTKIKLTKEQKEKLFNQVQKEILKSFDYNIRILDIRINKTFVRAKNKNLLYTFVMFDIIDNFKIDIFKENEMFNILQLKIIIKDFYEFKTVHLYNDKFELLKINEV